MTRGEAIKILNETQVVYFAPNGKAKAQEALEMAIETLTRPQGEWIFNPTDAIDLMFAKPKCSKCGFESSDGGNYCSNCGAMMIGGNTK